MKERKAATSRTYKAEIVESDSEMALVAKDIAAGEVVRRTAVSVPEQEGLPEGGSTFETLDECIADFDCTQGPALQCEANRTCEDILAHILCCLDNGQCLSVVFPIRPTELRCQLHVAFPDGGVFMALQ